MLIKKNFKLIKLTGNKILGIIITHMWGNSCNMTEIIKLCTFHKIPIIEDASESLGSFVKIKNNKC